MVHFCLKEQHGHGSGGCNAGKWEWGAKMEGRETHLIAERPQDKTLAPLQTNRLWG